MQITSASSVRESKNCEERAKKKNHEKMLFK